MRGRVSVFFGWFIVAAGVLIGTYHGGAIGFGFTAFIAPIAATFGWSYAQISLGLSFRGLEVGALDPFVGMAVDRWSAKRLVFIGVVLYGLGLVCISQASNLAMYYVGFLILGLGNSLSIHVVPQTTIARWFRRDLGKASGVLALGGSLGGVLVPVLVIMIDAYSWQTSLLVLALGFWAIGIPLSFIFRTSPEAYGLLPDGKPQYEVKGPSSLESYDFSVRVKDALKMRAFWHLSIASLLQMGSIHAGITHVMPYLASLGVGRSTAGTVAMIIPLLSLSARVPFGWLSDKFRKTYVMAVSAALTSAGMFLFWMIDGSNLWSMIAFAVVFGLGLGGPSPLRTPIVREYFGIKNFGTIYGLMGVSNMLSLLIYPPVAGWVYDTLGIYGPIWLIFGAASAIGVAIMVTTPLAKR
ncbi:MFS transporter [Chloroflexota bacterium]